MQKVSKQRQDNKMIETLEQVEKKMDIKAMKGGSACGFVVTAYDSRNGTVFIFPSKDEALEFVARLQKAVEELV